MRRDDPTLPVSPQARHSWWYEECPVHGKTEHGTVVKGCFKCADDRLTDAKGEE